MATRIILDNGTTLDSSPAMNLEFKVTSPIFSREAGSQTIADTLPPTVRNRRELGFPDRTDNASRSSTLFPVIVEDGSFLQPGEMAIHGTDDAGNISFNIGLDEGAMYAKMKEKKISELDDFYVYAPVSTPNVLRENIRLCVDKLCSNAANTDLEYAFFSIVLKQDVLEDVIYSFVLNQINGSNITSYNDVFWESRSIKMVVNGKIADINVLDGYGIAPFLKVWKVIEIIFENFGYRVVQNPFKTDFQLKLLTVLHNVVDGLCDGTIDYRHFVPDVKIVDFLDSLFYKFGAVYFVNSRTREVKVKLLKDILNEPNFNDLTSLKSSRLSWNNVPPKQLKLTANNGMAETKTDVSTFEEFLFKISTGVQKSITFEMVGDFPINNHGNIVAGFVNNKVTRRFFVKYILLHSTDVKFLSSDFFDWDRKTVGMEYEEYKFIDESIPQIIVPHIVPYRDSMMPGFLFGLVRKTTDLVTNTIDNEKEESDKFGFVFYFGKLPDLLYWASSFPIRDNGNLISEGGVEYTIFLNARSLYDHFFREWDQVLRHGNQEYTGKFALGKNDLLSFDITEKIMVDNQPFLAEEVNFSLLSLNQKNEVELKLHSLRGFENDGTEDLSVDEMNNLPEQMYYWRQHNDYNERLNETIINLRDNFIDSLYGSGAYDFKTVVVGTPIRDEETENEIAQEQRYPPSESQYVSGGKYFLRTLTGHVKITIYWYVAGNQNWESLESDFNYYVWFTAERI